MELSPVDMPEDTVKEISGSLSGGTMPGYTESVSLQYWFLQFRAVSGKLHLTVADFTEWLLKGITSWEANCDLVVGRLIALDKHPEVRPVGVGETMLQLIIKCVLRVAGQEANVACGTKHLVGGVDACIKGGIHGMHLLWVQNFQ